MPEREDPLWFTEMLDPKPELLGGGTLVLASSHRTAQSLRAWLVERGGSMGVDIATPSELAALVAPAQEPMPPSPVPLSHPMHERFHGRPGLTDRARQWVRWLVLVRATGSEPVAPAWLEELAHARWGVDEQTLRIEWLCQAARHRGCQFTETHRYHKVLTRGFATPSATRNPWEHWLACTLTGEPYPTQKRPLQSDKALPSIRVADPAEEARVAAFYAAKDPRGTVVLVAQPQTAWRVGDALRRNGLQVEHDEPVDGSSTPLGAATLVCADLLGPDAAPTTAPRLAQLARQWARYTPPRGWSAEFRALGISRGPLSLWVESADHAAPLAAQVIRTLHAHRKAQTPAELADCLGQLAGSASGLTEAQEAILNALSSGTELGDPASIKRRLRACRPPDRLATGVSILGVDDWDGRPCRQLLVLDVHHRGIGRRTAPDPLVTTDQQRGMHSVPAAQQLARRLSAVRVAAQSSERVRVLLCQRDATGRPLIAPLHLQLADLDERPLQSGVLPEFARRQTHVRTRSSPGVPPAQPDPLARQINLEWVRAGRFPGLPPVEFERYTALPKRLETPRDPSLAWADPWLGRTFMPSDSVPLAATSMTAAQLARPLNRCLYSAFLAWELQLEDPSAGANGPVERAIQTVLESVWETATRTLPERTHPARLAHLRQAAERGLGALFEDPTTEALTGVQLSAQVELRRWRSVWLEHARARINPPIKPFTDAWDLTKRVGPFVKNHPEFQEAFAQVRELFEEVAPEEVRIWLSWVSERIAKGQQPVQDRDAFLCRSTRKRGQIPEGRAEDARDWIRRGAAGALARVWQSAWRREKLRRTEAGTPLTLEGQPLRVQVGSHTVNVGGRDPRVVPTTVGNHTAVELTLYTLGSRPQGSAWVQSQRLWSMQDVELALEVLRLSSWVQEQEHPFGIASARRDWVQHDESEAPILLDGPTIRAMESSLAVLLDAMARGEWALDPVPAHCPALGAYGASCPGNGICRLRGQSEGS